MTAMGGAGPRRHERRPSVSDKPQLTPEQTEAVVKFFEDWQDAVNGTGEHEGHTLSQAGRCVYCSCGFRLGQANLRELRKEAARD
jgi:hypothetical protein